jgi:hypothetical protein
MTTLKELWKTIKREWKTSAVAVMFVAAGFAYFFKYIKVEEIVALYGALGGLGFTLTKDASK